MFKMQDRLKSQCLLTSDTQKSIIIDYLTSYLIGTPLRDDLVQARCVGIRNHMMFQIQNLGTFSGSPHIPASTIKWKMYNLFMHV